MKGFIFDLDGVIVDTAHFHFLAWKKTADELGLELTEEMNEQLKGVSRIDSLKKILAWADKEISQDHFDKLTTEKNTDYLSYVEEMTSGDILPGVEAFITQIKSQGYPVALGSASKNAPRILKKIGLFDLFDTIVDGNSVKKAKPDPEVFVIAAGNLGVAREECVVFEDSEAGVTAANNAGMVSIGIGSPENLGHADHVFGNFTEFSTEFIVNLEPKVK
ncbi:beta-phosphoglucomutase [Robertkochia flava]|uniref:beta-phosphoglucomutase n=1 Tax=Robertkochia flava TaxID=3447986 RepID=UPI001CCDC5C7|nr:beta-phosphoglucomutase [Robertkochia marina]